MKTVIACVVGVVGGGVAVATIDQRHPAVVVPTAPLTYSGVLVGSNGVPVANATDYQVKVEIFADGSGSDPNPCSQTDEGVAFTQGRFRADVSNCASVPPLSTTGQGFVQVTVTPSGGSPTQIPTAPPFPAIGSVPFALIAQSAGSANSATTASSVPFGGVTNTSPVAITEVQHVGLQDVAGNSLAEIAQITFTAPASGAAVFFASGWCPISNSAQIVIGLGSSATPCDPNSSGSCAVTVNVSDSSSAGPQAIPYALQASFPAAAGSNTLYVSAHAVTSLGGQCSADMSVLFSATTLPSSSTF